MTNQTQQPRPTRKDAKPLAAKVIAQLVKAWLKDDSDIADIESLLVENMGGPFDNGYSIAKGLEDASFGIDPDLELVEILDDCDIEIRNAHNAMCREWVSANGIREIPTGTSVLWKSRPKWETGIVVSNHPDGKSTVSFASQGHVAPGTGMGTIGRIIEWEELEILSANVKMSCDPL